MPLKVADKNAVSFALRAKSATKAELIIYDQIGESFFGGGISAKSVSDALGKMDPAVNEIEVRINSPGGDVFDGYAIYNRLKQHKAKKTVYIDGVAASIASIIALAGDEVIMGEGALYMIHLPWTFAMGNRMELENTTNRLMDVEEQLLTVYSKRTGLDRSELRAMLEKETWFDADQAIDQGFADRKFEDTVAVAASMMNKAQWINKVPRGLKTESDLAKQKIANLKNKIAGLQARK